MTKEDLKSKIWEGDGFDYYFSEYDPNCSLMEECLDPESLGLVLEAVDAFNTARDDLATVLDSVGLGPSFTHEEEE